MAIKTTETVMNAFSFSTHPDETNNIDGGWQSFLDRGNAKRGYQHGLYAASVKMDGHRIFWDGGLSRRYGWTVANCPFSNKEVVNHKSLSDSIKAQRLSERCTGVWTRYYNRLAVPTWWLRREGLLGDNSGFGGSNAYRGDTNVFVEGEVWLGIGRFQEVSTLCKTLPHPALDLEASETMMESQVDDLCCADTATWFSLWREARFVAFDIIPAALFLEERDVRINGNRKMRVNRVLPGVTSGSIIGDAVVQSLGLDSRVGPMTQFAGRLKVLESFPVNKVEQHTPLTGAEVKRIYNQAIAEGHEGIILKARAGLYRFSRGWEVVKVKPMPTCEAIIGGWEFGETESRKVDGTVSEGRNAHRVGSYLCSLISGGEDQEGNLPAIGSMFQLSGMTDEQREIAFAESVKGRTVRVLFDSWTADGLPRNPRWDCLVD